MKLLLVDDDESNRLTLSVLLEDEGYEVDTAASFTEARAKLLGPAAAYDGVLLDQHLGDGLGLDLLEVVRGNLPGAKAVLISGSIREPEGTSSGADAVLPKATPFPEALAILRRTLGQSRLAG
jgi:DNA-binding response OmpR family regulator